jgi:hypothetical protein
VRFILSETTGVRAIANKFLSGKINNETEKKNLENTYTLIWIGHPIPKGDGAISVGIATSNRLDGPGI